MDREKNLSNFLPNIFLHNKYSNLKQLTNNIKCDIAVIGGGMAGLTTAHEFASRGLKVVLIEKYFCGAGASGKSSGFITPDSEYSLADLIKKYGENDAKKIWNFATAGVEHIRNSIEKYGLKCDYMQQDTVIFANKQKDISVIEKEHASRLKFGYDSSFYSKNKISKILNSSSYKAAVKYTGSFGINAYQYCQEMKNYLNSIGVLIFEDTPALEIGDNYIKTPSGLLKAEYIILCVDKDTPELNKLKHKIYHAQTFLALSAPLNDKQINKLFPQGPIMAWDTSLIYYYFRLTGEQRLMLGGASIFHTYARKASLDSTYMKDQLTKYAEKKFLDVDIDFNYMWPGLIGITKDFFPIGGFDKDQKNLYIIAGCAGLPWAAAMGIYCTQRIVDGYKEFDHYFDPYRKYPLGETIQKIIGTPLTFAISNFSILNSL